MTNEYESGLLHLLGNMNDLPYDDSTLQWFLDFHQLSQQYILRADTQGIGMEGTKTGVHHSDVQSAPKNDKEPHISGHAGTEQTSYRTHCPTSDRSAELPCDVATAANTADHQKIQEEVPRVQESTLVTEPQHAKRPRYSSNDQVKPSSSDSNCSISMQGTHLTPNESLFRNEGVAAFKYTMTKRIKLFNSHGKVIS
jgi:hypothetical protein